VGRNPARQWWKVKYVELRRGNLCYYEDSGEGRKIIHLRQSDTIVRVSSSRGPGFVFELIVQGSPARFWAASSEEERLSWVRAIRAAMIGGDGFRRELDLAPHQEAIEIYQSLRNAIGSTDLHENYMAAFESLFDKGQSLRVPLQWVQEQVQPINDDSQASFKQLKVRVRSPHKRLKTSIHEFWTSMAQTTFAINGLIVPRLTPLASERIMGGLTRCILEYDKAYREEVEEETGMVLERGGCITELQAISYARDILMSVLRRKEQQDLAVSVTHLLGNPDLIDVVAQLEEEPVHLEVSFAGQDLPDDLPQVGNEMAGWLRTRRKHFATNKWKARYAVLSGAVLSYYEAASPHPHGLRGQLVLSGATIQDESPEGEEQFVFCVVVPDEKRLFSFKQELEYQEWREAIQLSIDNCAALTEDRQIDDRPTLSENKAFSKSILKGIKVALPDASLRGGIRAIKGATGGGMKVIKSATDGSMKVIRGAVGMKVIRGAVGMLRHKSSDVSSGLGMQRRPSMQMLINNTALGGGKRDPTVQCVVQSTQTFVVSERSEYQTGTHLLSVRAKLFQAFLLSGGQNGRIARGDALVELDFIEAVMPEDESINLRPSWYFR
jgi:hypothetical protein